VGEFRRAGAEHLLLEFHGGDKESYELFVDRVMRVFL
jgi:hypothetical protein